MQRNRAMSWFGPFLFVATFAAAIVIGLSVFVQAKMMAPAAEGRQLIASPGATPEAGWKHVIIEPSHILVTARRSAVQVGTRANPPSRDQQPG